jgi:hypothetical protein
MGDHFVVMAVATYRSKAAAEQDFDAVGRAKYDGDLDLIAAAVLEKGADGALAVERHEPASTDVAWAGALLGAALTVIAAPLGVLLLAAVIATRSAWAGAAALVDHFWHDIPRDDLSQMSNLLEAGQAAVVIVAVGYRAVDVMALCSNSTSTFVTDGTAADFEADFSNAIDEARVLGRLRRHGVGRPPCADT